MYGAKKIQGGKLTNIENRLKEEKKERLDSKERMNKRIEKIEKAIREDKGERKRAEEEKINRIILREEEGESSVEKKIGLIERRLGRLEDDKGKQDDNKGRDEGKNKEELKISEEMKWIVETNEREKRKRNIIIKGLEESITRDMKLVESWCAMKLGIELKAKKNWKVRGIEKAIGIQLESKEHKEQIMRKKKVLKDERTRVYIDNDLTWIERKNKKIVWEKAREMQNKGETAIMKYNKIVSGNDILFWNERQEK